MIIKLTQPQIASTFYRHCTPSCTLRSSDSKLLFVPRVRKCFGSRSFAIAAPTIWNFLWPFVVVSSLTVFGANSKLSSITQLSSLLNRPTPPSALDSAGLSLTLCALQIYLLTDMKKIQKPHAVCCNVHWSVVSQYTIAYNTSNLQHIRTETRNSLPGKH